jgi:acyl-coenzyme A synthetase/AMP-(fatty) acid ligase
MARFFWQKLAAFGERSALLDEENGILSYRQVSEMVECAASHFQTPNRKLIFLAAENDVGAILCYLGALTARQPVFIAQKGALDGRLLEAYRPDILLWKGPDQAPSGYEVSGTVFGYTLARVVGEGSRIGSDLALLLSTSGSLQSPKVVRLSWENIGIAAEQVADALQIEPGDRTVTSLPLAFVYGLSVVNSNLHAGASIVVTDRSVQDPRFWRLVDGTDVTSMAGVPWTYKSLQAIGYDPSAHPRLVKLLLSGGAPDANVRQWLVDLSRRPGLRVFSMYGQTEATGRMCVLPPESLVDKPASVGRPVRGGAISCNATGDIVYRGPNVMLGYAHNRADLGDGNDMAGVLPTGDSGYMDGDGDLYLTGRTSRVAKLFSLRLNLDEIEALLSSAQPVAAACRDDHLSIYLEGQPTAELASALEMLASRLRLPPHHLHLRSVRELPRTAAGKINYGDLANLATD